jgi:serine-type D-Ala-D-Ala carboxypeptidase (penicillin-binding protein 5/6)
VVSDRGEILWEREAKARVAIASTTKMVTALVVRRSADLDEEVTVSGQAAATEQGKLSLIAGESFSVEELLWGLLLNSSNDAAVALAEYVSGSEAAFVGEMNALAADLGATDTSFRTSHGLDAPGHYSTALDLADIAEELLRDPVLSRMVGTFSHTIVGSERSVELENTNVLLETYPGIEGIKTGFTAQAGNVLVAAAQRDGRRIVTVALGSVDHFADTRVLLDLGFQRLSNEILLEKDVVVTTMLADGWGAFEISSGAVVRGLEPPDGVEYRFAMRKGLRLPVSVGERVGTVLVSADGEVVGRSPALAAQSVGDAGGSWLATAIGDLLGAVAGVLPGE